MGSIRVKEDSLSPKISIYQVPLKYSPEQLDKALQKIDDINDIVSVHITQYQTKKELEIIVAREISAEEKGIIQKAFPGGEHYYGQLVMKPVRFVAGNK